jgi:heme/copper-type cytochrome/quinol oxidase subunit 3
MRGKAALIGFLVLQAVIVAVWLTALLPLTKAGAAPFISTDSGVWSGAVFSDIATNFRTRSSAVTSAQFSPTGPLFWATILMVLSGVCAFLASFFFHRRRIWIAAGLAGATLLLGAGAAYFIVEQWSGDTSFPPGAVNVVWLYMSTRSFLIQLVLGFLFLAVGAVLAIAGVATTEKPLGFHLVALNWIVVSVVWLLMYLGLFVLPFINAAS